MLSWTTWDLVIDHAKVTLWDRNVSKTNAYLLVVVQTLASSGCLPRRCRHLVKMPVNESWQECFFVWKRSHFALILTRFRNGPQIEESQCRGVKGRLLPHSWWILGSGCGRVWAFIYRNLWLLSLLQNSTGHRPWVSSLWVFFSLLVPTDICRMYYGLNTWLHKIGEVKCIVQFHTYIIGTSCHMDFWFTLLLLFFFLPWVFQAIRIGSHMCTAHHWIMKWKFCLEWAVQREAPQNVAPFSVIVGSTTPLRLT